MWHNVCSLQHTYMISSYRSNRLGLSHWNPYAVRRGSCLELYYCNMVEWFWWDSSLISTTNWFPSVLWHCWFGHLACENRPRNDLLCVEWDVKPYTLTPFVAFSAPAADKLANDRRRRNVHVQMSWRGMSVFIVAVCFHHDSTLALAASPAHVVNVVGSLISLGYS